MQLTNLKVATEQVSFLQAVRQGLGQQQGLFFPTRWPKLDIDALLALPLVERSSKILAALIGDELPEAELLAMLDRAFTFPAPLVKVTDNVSALELFHGPTLAFKDFGGRFMAQALAKAQPEPTTIVTATSGDTGAAVAHAFYRQSGVQVVILFPKGKISSLQEKLFTTLGDNITTLAVDGDFDQCQALVKQVFDNKALVEEFNITSANSINISRLFAQICYYFEAIAQVPPAQRDKVVISVPSGNFGNLTAGLIAKAMGLPIKRMIAATNSNDTVPRYWQNQQWQPKTTVATLSNAMDVSAPNNWPRVEALLAQGVISRADIAAVAVDEDDTQLGVRQLWQLGYLSEPHAAVAYKALKRSLAADEFGIFFGTAHPAKFKEQVENILGSPIALPPALAACAAESGLSIDIAADFAALEQVIRTLKTRMTDWQQLLGEQKQQPYFQKLLDEVAAARSAGTVIYPPQADVFNAFKLTGLAQLKVVVLGQDPYHGPNQAHGLAFSVRDGVKVPPSLANIYKELALEYPDFCPPGHGNLQSWAGQGVLLLNTVLTVIANQPNSHRKLGWEQFTDQVITAISQNCQGIVFLLWGSHAQKKARLIDGERHHILTAPHPSPLSAHRGF